MLRVPYKWSYKPFSNISYMWSDLVHGIGNVFRWIPVIWYDVDWDWDPLAAVMEYKLRRMSKALARGHHVGDERYSRQCLVAAELLKRIQNDSIYFRNADLRHPARGKRWAEHIHAIEKYDLEYLLKIMRNLRKWWS